MLLSMNAVSWDLERAPTLVASSSPPLNSIRVGMPRRLNLAGVVGLAATSFLPTFTLPEYTSQISSTRGAIILQGPHQAAQKSTSTGMSEPTTSLSKLESVT